MSVVPKENDVTVETMDSLPQDVHKIALLRNEVIAWTSLDPEFARYVGTNACCNSFGPFLLIPCFWPYLLILWPFLCCEKTNVEKQIRNQYWILTETELKIVTKDHDACCLPGCIKAGDSVKTIPLESITDCGSSDARNGWLNSCVKTLPVLYVDSQQQKTMGYGLARQDWFIREVLNRRDIVKGNLSLNACQGAAVAMPVVVRGDSATSPADRLKEITELHNSGVLTREEFLGKRKDIIDSI